jgi:hypothetical protein
MTTAMNGGLAAFAILLIAIGALSGVFILSILGVFLLIPALLVPNRNRPTVPVPTVPRSRVRPPMQGSQPTQTAAMPTAKKEEQMFGAAVAAQTSPPAPMAPTSQALFPNAMFPSLSVPQTYQTAAPTAPPKPSGDDEVMGMAALLVLLRFLSG